DALLQMQVLIYRESHGWEVRYPFFTDQFEGLELTNENTLNRKIDGISGATLSVNALTRLSKLALHLHKEAMQL
ncbi:MAG: FMN-binding protein, partial [Opitutales bacterium]|nr:FMN-binding protein [Opitutales bacterium]